MPTLIFHCSVVRDALRLPETLADFVWLSPLKNPLEPMRYTQRFQGSGALVEADALAGASYVTSRWVAAGVAAA
jgi:hypothetical protein